MLTFSCQFLSLMALALSAGLGAQALAADTSPAQQLSQWSAAAGKPGSASCHGTPPTGDAKHASTGKAIKPLAPAFNPQTFTDSARVDKWFRRNCKDVLSRECSAAEKADVMAYLISLKR
jgi:hypothetical protein